MKDLTKLEELVLMSIWRLGDDAYGVKIKRHVKKLAGKEYLYNTLYTTFDQLTRKGFINKLFGEPTAIRGGKSKVFFLITRQGIKALENAYLYNSRVWGGVTIDSFQQGSL
jgi:PadR family transcriptional regulator, regulatory protein PadR